MQPSEKKCHNCAFFKAHREDEPKLEDFPPEYFEYTHGMLWWKRKATYLSTEGIGYFSCEWASDWLKKYPENTWDYEYPPIAFTPEMFGDVDRVPKHIYEYLLASMRWYNGKCYRMPEPVNTNRDRGCGEFTP